MKNIFGILLLTSALFAADPLDLNHITITTDQDEQAALDDDLKFYQAESIRLDIFVKRNGKRVEIPEDAFSVWTAWTDGAPTTLYINDTGTVFSVSAGTMRNELTPAEANLAAGTYKTQVQLFEGATRMGVIASGDLVVSYSPSSGDVVYTGPTGAILSGVTLTNWTSAGTVTGLDAVDVVVDASSFTNNLSATDTKVQIALQTIDAMTAGGSGDLTGVLVTGGNLTISSATGPVPTIGLTSGQIVTASGVANYLPLAGGAMSGAITTSSTFDGVDVGTFKTAVDLFDTAAERKTLYSALGSAWNDSKDTTFLSIDTAAERKTLYAALGSAFTDALFTKLGTIDADADVTFTALPGTTKGDVIVRNGSTYVRVGIGDDDQVLTADAGEDSGVKWADAGGGGGGGGKVFIPATRFMSFDTGSVDDWAHLNHELDTASYALEGSGARSGSATPQTARMKATVKTPKGASSWATSNAIKIKVWADDDTDAKIIDINVYGRDLAGTYTVVEADSTDITMGAANVPEEIVIDDSDLSSTTIFEYYTVEIIVETANSDTMWIHGVTLDFD